MRTFKSLLLTLLASASAFAPVASAGEFDTTVAMNAKDAATYYVHAEITGLGPVELMVDTGSGYMTINEEMLQTLQTNGQARYVKDLRGRLANGSEMNVPVYAIGAINIGEECWLHDIEAAVFPGKTRPILGLNALQRAAPFIFSFEPPRLQLSNCGPLQRADAKRGDTADLATFDE